MKSSTNFVLLGQTILLLFGMYVVSFENITQKVRPDQLVTAKKMQTMDKAEPTGESDAKIKPATMQDGQKGSQPTTQKSDTKTKPVDHEDDYEEQVQGLPPFVVESGEGFDVRNKQNQVKELVERGVQYMETNSLDSAFNAFSHSLEFRLGELYLFVYTYDGTVLAHGGWPDMLWKNQWDEQDDFGTYIVRDIVNTGREKGEEGGWIIYRWKGASKRSYVRRVRKNNKEYVIGSGFYPHSKADAVMNLVQGAVAYFNDIINEEGRSVVDVFSTFNYPLGRFVQGDLYLYVLKFNGDVMAHGERPGLVGTNGWDFQDATGVYVNREIIKKLKESTTAIWQKYTSKNAPKIAYAKEVKDREGNQYFIACGYYPDANRNEVMELVKRGYQFFKRHGKETSAKEFSDKRSNRFRYGDLALVVYNFEGLIVANGENPDIVGVNNWNVQDDDGKYIVRDIIARAKAGNGWVSFNLKNSYKLVYVEKLDLGVEQFAITSGLYPISKAESMWLMVKSAVTLFQAKTLQEALRQFVWGPTYLRGDLWVYVLDTAGIVLAWGHDYNRIWKKILNEKDELGKTYIRTLITAARQGPSTLTYKLQGAKRVAYAEEVKKNGRGYIIGSAYYR